MMDGVTGYWYFIHLGRSLGKFLCHDPVSSRSVDSDPILYIFTHFRFIYFYLMNTLAILLTHAFTHTRSGNMCVCVLHCAATKVQSVIDPSLHSGLVHLLWFDPDDHLGQWEA